MAKRDILKEAIADAKTVKETAIANAKAALEEAFTPRLKEMLATKLEEMDLEEEKEDMKEMSKKEKAEGDDRKDDKIEKETELMRESEELDEEIDLDEILAEIEEMDKKDIDEDARTDAEEEGYEDGMEDEKEDMEDKEDEEIDLEDMTDEDLKDFIEDVIADMVASGDLEAGENFEEEGEEEEVDVDVEDDVDVEISEAKKKDKDEDEEDKEVKESMDIDEVSGFPMEPGKTTAYDLDPSDPRYKSVSGELGKFLSGIGVDIKSMGQKGIDKVMSMLDFSEPASPLQKKLRDAGTGKAQRFQNRFEEDGIDEAKNDEELKEAYNTIESLRSDLNEVNLLNAKLLYTNKIFKAKTLTESQKVKVLGAFDKAGTVKETKLVFETLSEGLKEKKKSPITESLGAASRVSRSVNAKKPIIETDPMVARFQKLAGLK